jgi:hypothetical protein
MMKEYISNQPSHEQVKNDFREIIRDEIGTKEKLITEHEYLMRESMPVTIFNKKISLASRAGVIAFIAIASVGLMKLIEYLISLSNPYR